MWILRAKHSRITIFLTAAPDDSLESLKQQLFTALRDTHFDDPNDDDIRLKISGIVHTDYTQTLSDAGLGDGAVFEFAPRRHGQWIPFYIEPYPESTDT
ncbi:uncharacterized protein T551_00628 [Pneumocystis jirovecii RU7]|uniref:Ubiquitin-like domain-containing protein n=1 Tax=Pneumocystis jirovecii (strain RU7) TaxID=1408657 RepID=A0A0W4ZU94_PNEJ7|nr:uncharacterized protein T551_00628 [Pneumocystis jirovecii RU7]KTW31945.1 hypothetical protein T551_00628 [Pneumocystis jirovecii RU7]